jgi:hypothetical protein
MLPADSSRTYLSWRPAVKPHGGGRCTTLAGVLSRSVKSTVTGLLVALGLCACGSSSSSSSSSSGNGVAAKSPDAILSAATTAIEAASSAHVAGNVANAGTSISLDLSLVSGKGARGTMSENGLSFQLVDLGGSVYINASDAFWRRFGGNAAAQVFHGKWLKAPADRGSFASLAGLTNLHQLFNALLTSHGALSKGATTTVDGQPVIGLQDKTKGGTLYVATTGKPYPVEVLKSGTNGGHLVFDHINQSVPLSAPANAIDISQFKSQ